MTPVSADEVFATLTASLLVRADEGLVEVRRAGDEAVLLFRWPPLPDLFGVPVSLTRTDRRLDWDRPAVDLGDWLESVDLWLMEDVENGFTYRARRRRVGDYIELRGPSWPTDERFYTDVVSPGDGDSWLRVPFVARDGLNTGPAVADRKTGVLVAWVTGYENNSTGSPYVGQATVVRDADGAAALNFVELVDRTPATLLLDVVRAATHAAADAGFRTVVTHLDLPHLDVAGFRRRSDGPLSLSTDFLTEDPAEADAIARQGLANPGLWGRDRDAAGRYLPRTRAGRLVHRLRYGRTGAKRRVYIG